MRGSSTRRWVAAAAIAAVLLAGGAYGIFALVAGGDVPPPVALPSMSPSEQGASRSTGAATDPDGSWTIDASSSFVGYRVREKLAVLPAPSDAVGRTTTVTGSMEISGLEISSVDVSADLTQLHSDESRRDDRIRTSGLETNSFPEATFALTSPITFDKRPAEGETVDVTAVGDLALHGITRSVQVPLQARWTGSTIEVVGSLDINFRDYSIQAPRFAGFVSVEDHGTVELQLTFVPA